MFTEPVLITAKITVWNGTSWDNGFPDIRTAAVISKDLTLTAGLTACRLTVTDGC
ncbi:MAG: hypothetical protein I8H68_08370 [Flavobacteriia bacterium]|nr:hypothetical protein [Flavobacteriia bacterium]MBH2023807.1 hypothetical protein [Flavobacteriales bacterium]